MICCHGLQVYRRTSENKINSQQAARAAYSCQGTLYGAFTDIPVVLPDEMDNIKILIAVKQYLAICQQCKSMGKRFFEDYLPFDFFEYTEIDIIMLDKIVGSENVREVLVRLIGNRKIAIVIGNCQTEYIQKFMRGSCKFMQHYLFIKIPMIHMINSEKEQILKEHQFIFQKCSLCITQEISNNNGFSEFLCTENLCKIMDRNTQIVKIPILYFDIYYPQTVHQYNPIEILKEVGVLSFPYGDCILDELAKRYTSSEIVEIVRIENFFSSDFLENFRKDRIKKLKEREKRCDIKILDYILDNYKKELLFYSKNHPSNKVIIELVKRIFEFLGYNDFQGDSIICNELNMWQELIYPSVYKAYELQFEKETYMDPALDESCCFETMVTNYVSYVHNVQ